MRVSKLLGRADTLANMENKTPIVDSIVHIVDPGSLRKPGS